ncbi:MAG: PQQ-dependent dehydrogenase, methanol/ethanol family [Acidobacteriota bacterium]
MKKVFCLILLTGLPIQAEVLYEDLLIPPADNWLSYSGDLTGQRYSLLKQINTTNAGSLVPQWVYHVKDSKRLQATPLVVDGVMYISHTNEVYALDAATGRELWHYKYSQAKRHDGNRGVAVLGDRVFFVSSDAHLLALHAKTGALLWDREYGGHDQNPQLLATLAPLAINGKVIVGVSGGDCGIRGFVDAFDAESGRHLWRFYTIPGPGEPGFETWGGHPVEISGGATWMTGTYDAGQNLLLWTVGNPGPDFNGDLRPGDNLYSDSVVALDADTGKLKWYYQFTPHDTHDWDAQEFPVLIDGQFQGKPRKLLVQANRNGFFYVLDRTNGQVLLAKPFVKKMNWAKGILPNGRPDLIADRDPTPAGNLTCPGVKGATNWFSPSYNPDTGLFYVVSIEQCDIYTTSARPFKPGECYDGTGAEPDPAEPGQFFLRAIDVQTGDIRWEIPMIEKDTMEPWPGTVSTAGGLVFFGDNEGYLAAADASTGKVLWHFNTGQIITASPMTYRVNGKQFVALASGTDIFAFGLFEPMRPEPMTLKERFERREKSAGN